LLYNPVLTFCFDGLKSIWIVFYLPNNKFYLSCDNKLKRDHQIRTSFGEKFLPEVDVVRSEKGHRYD
jgi:hypothetical protein